MKETKQEGLVRVDRKLAYTGSIMHVYQDAMQLPDGKIVNWDYFPHKGGAAVVPVLDTGEILMVRQYRNALDRETLEIPAGAFDTAGEEGKVCALRELEEETGYRPDSLEFLLQTHSLPAFTNEKVSIYVATGLKKTRQHLDEQEFLQVEKWKLADLMEKIFEGSLMDGKTVCALLAYQLKLLKEMESTSCIKSFSNTR